MTTLYKPFGCFNNSSNNAFSTNLTEITNKKYSINECNKAAINNNSSVFGMIHDTNKDIGSCFLSNPNLSSLEQSYQAVKDGIIINGCQDNFGNKKNNSIFVYLNNKALTFFDDINDVSEKAKKSEESYLNQLEELNKQFNTFLNNFKNNTEKEFKPYINNDLNTIFEKADFTNIEILNDKFNTLFKSITMDNVSIFNKIEKLNKEIQILDNHIIKAKKSVKNIKTSNNAALGNVTDINFRLDAINGENIALIIIPLILIILFFNQSSSNQSSSNQSSSNQSSSNQTSSNQSSSNQSSSK